MTNLDQLDPGFVADLEASKPAVLAVARYLERCGVTVTVPEIKVRPTVDQRADFADDGDIRCYHHRLGHFITEVKGRDLDFDHETPYPFTTLILDPVARFKAKGETPFVYYIVNAQLSHAQRVLVPSTQKSWTVEYVNDPRNERGHYECYLVHRNLARTVTL